MRWSYIVRSDRGEGHTNRVQNLYQLAAHPSRPSSSDLFRGPIAQTVIPNTDGILLGTDAFNWTSHHRIIVWFMLEGQKLSKIRCSPAAVMLTYNKDSGHTSEQKLKMPAKYVFRMQHSHSKTRHTGLDAHFTVDETGVIRNCPIALGAIHPAARPSRRNRLSIGGFDPSSLNQVR